MEQVFPVRSPLQSVSQVYVVDGLGWAVSRLNQWISGQLLFEFPRRKIWLVEGLLLSEAVECLGEV